MNFVTSSLVALLLLSGLASCGGDATVPTEPDIPAPAPAVANLVIEGGAWVSCGSTSCNYAGEFRNVGY